MSLTVDLGSLTCLEIALKDMPISFNPEGYDFPFIVQTCRFSSSHTVVVAMQTRMDVI